MCDAALYPAMYKKVGSLMPQQQQQHSWLKADRISVFNCWPALRASNWLRWLRRRSVCCPSRCHCHISKIKQERPIIRGYYVTADSVAAFRSSPIRCLLGSCSGFNCWKIRSIINTHTLLIDFGIRPQVLSPWCETKRNNAERKKSKPMSVINPKCRPYSQLNSNFICH